MIKKWYLKLGALCLAVMVLTTPFQSEAICSDWGLTLNNVKTYCATPICHTGNRTEFTEKKYSRTCTDGLFTTRTEYKIEKIDNGCCPYN